MNKAIFLDRDGTIIEEKNYLSNKKEIIFLEGVFEGLKKLQQEYLLIIVTNQSGVARGYFNEIIVKKINNEIINQLAKKNIKITDVFYCPHYINGKIKKYSIKCDCRKPKTGMIKKAQTLYNIDLNNSYIIGDKDSDIELAENANCKSIFINNNNYQPNKIPDFSVKSILEASEIILNVERRK